ncbi:alpha-glucosidase [Dietzia psychralcaliphila]|nr:alpha-glucosidase [Dietzia psychralcaliphila]
MTSPAHAPRQWEDMVLYQIYPRSFADSDGDGAGDLQGVIDRVGYLELLGVDGVWLSPIMRSPGADHGYDVSDPRDVDPLFGDVDTLRHLVEALHAARMVLIMDLVPNHTSVEHPWFDAALAAGPGSPERERYFFRDGLGEDGSQPPNNWPSVFGGPAWTRVTEPDGTPGQWYLHLFAPEQPDLDWSHPDVGDDLDETLRFWLDLGVDGFRIDVAHGLAKPDDLADLPDDVEIAQLVVDQRDARWDRPGVHDVHRRIRAVVDEYPGAATFGEVWVGPVDRFARYLRPDELHFAFHFALTGAPFEAGAVREAIDSTLEASRIAGSAPTWALSNHDVVREVTRYGNGTLGTARARAMLLVELALPGITFLYEGSELGLPSDYSIPHDRLTDPTWERSGHAEMGRDHCRVPIPWEGSRPPYGFSTSDHTWLPMPASWGCLTVEAQIEDPESTLSLYRAAIETRRAWPGPRSASVEWYGAPSGCLAFRRDDGVVCALNTSDRSVPLPRGEVLLSSGPLPSGPLASESPTGGVLPPDTAVWLRPH